MGNFVGSKFDLIQNLTSTKSGTVTFTLPKPDGTGNQDAIVGYLIGDVSIKLANKWQAVLPNIDAVTLASQIIGDEQNALAWIRSTQSAWMGSEPLRLAVPFYLFSLNSESKISDKINMFRQLLVPYQVSGSEFGVKLHGGYRPEIFTGDWASQSENNNFGKQSFVTIDAGNGLNSEVGLIKIKVGNQFQLTKMLLEDIVTDNSSVQVADGNPLYIKATATFKSSRVLYSQEILQMFTNV